jgi:hypothetical protein
MRRRGPPSTEVPEEYGPSCIRERQNQRGPVFARRHVEATTTPIDRVQGEGHDLTRAQAIGGDKEEHGVVAEAPGSAAVNGLQQPLDSWPRQTAWQVLLAIDARGIDLTVEARAHESAGRQEAEEAPELSDSMLQRGSAQPLPRPANEGLHGGRRERGESLGLELVVEVGEKVLRRGDMLLDGSPR